MAITATYVTGARSASFVIPVDAAPGGNAYSFADIAAAYLAAGGSRHSAFYKFFKDNEAANLAKTQELFASNGVSLSAVSGTGATLAIYAILNAHSLQVAGATADSQLRISLAASISA
jgi:hypothetical protein